MNLVPSGAISDVDGGARLIGPRRPSPEKAFMPSKRAGRLRRGGAEEACVGCRLSLSSTTLAFTSMVGGSSLAGAARAVLPERFWGALAAEHALQERGGLDQLAGASQAGGFANYVMIEHLITSFCRRERP